MRNPEISGLSVVLVGDLNPRIFQPHWFALQEIITQEEAEAAEIEIIHSDISLFRLAWCQVKVTKDRYVISTTQDPYFEILRDFTVRTFAVLSHTPMAMLGINPEAHYRLRSLEQWHDFGHRLVPKEIWMKCLDRPGLRTLVVEESKRRDGRPGRVGVRVEPSNRILPGLYVQMNDHYDSTQPGGPGSAEDFTKILLEGWQGSMNRWKEISACLTEEV